MSCNNGLSPCPSGGATGSRLNGFDENSRKAKKPRLRAACAASVAISVSSRSLRSKIAIKPPDSDRIISQSSIDPSRLPHVPATLKIIGFRLLLLRATSSTDMSERTNSAISRPNATAG